MRILRIGLTNLNSLRGAHAVDLETGPLAEAGIFAITGPTGAGKSTLLDAVTLALYGRAARYGKAPNPEDMMSRHTGECSAEVVFEVRGQRYRAEWQLKRARKNPTGKVQPSKRFVYDSSGTVLTQKLGEADALVEELTGLDYERFLRSAMLAQGDFARFLKANASERSALLESLTGTQIYSRLSELCHEEDTRRRAELKAREEALGAFRLLDEEALETLRQEIARITDALGTARRESEAQRGDIERGRLLVGLLAKEAGLRAQSAELEQEAQRRAPEFQRLELSRQALVFQPAQTKLSERQLALEHAVHAAKEADSAATAARVNLRAGLEVARLAAEEDARQAGAEAEKTRGNVRKWQEESEAIARWQKSHAADATLTDRLPDLAEAIRGRANDAAAAESLARRLRDAEKADAELAEEQKQLAAARTVARKDAEDLSLRLAQCQAALAQLLDGTSPDELRATFETMRARHDRQARAAKLKERLSELEKNAAEATGEHKTASDLLRAKREVVDLLRQSLENARLVASLEEHRHALKAGEPCPLCGALEHPFASPDKRPREDEGRLAEARQELAALEKREREHAEALARNAESQRGLREELAGLTSADEGAAPVTGEQIESLRQRIQSVAGAEKELSSVEKSTIAAKGRVEKTDERIAGCVRQQKTQAQERDRLVAEIEKARVAADSHAERLAGLLKPFGVPMPPAGTETALRTELDRRAAEWRTQAESLAGIGGRIGDAQRELSKCEERAKRSRDRADDFLGSVRAEHLHDVALPSSLPEIADIDTALKRLRDARSAAEARAAELRDARERAAALLRSEEEAVTAAVADSVFADIGALRAAILPQEDADALAAAEKNLSERRGSLLGQAKQVAADLAELRAKKAPEGEELAAKEEAWRALAERIEQQGTQLAALRAELARDAENRKEAGERAKEIADERERLTVWSRLHDLIGSADGKKFRTFAQGLSLDFLLRHANRHLRKLTERYELRRAAGEALQLEIIDLHQANATRPMESLSGGESFLASLALALGLSDLAGRNVRIDTLFIDEGFGALDHDTLDVAVAALEGLRTGSKMVGVISHVDLLKERIGTQLRVQPGPGGISGIEVVSG